MKGLLDVPICCVEDFTEPRYLLSPPTGQQLESVFPPPKGNTRYSANIQKGVPAVGIGKDRENHGVIVHVCVDKFLVCLTAGNLSAT